MNYYIERKIDDLKKKINKNPNIMFLDHDRQSKNILHKCGQDGDEKLLKWLIDIAIKNDLTKQLYIMDNENWTCFSYFFNNVIIKNNVKFEFLKYIMKLGIDIAKPKILPLLLI